PRFVPDGPVEQADPGQVFAASGHRYPRRTMTLVLDPASSPETAQEQTLLLPDSAQVASGYLEVTVALSIAGSMHAGASSNDTFAILWAPVPATNAILRFVDEHKAPRAGFRALVRDPQGVAFEVQADAHGEVYLSAPTHERFQ